MVLQHVTMKSILRSTARRRISSNWRKSLHAQHRAASSLLLNTSTFQTEACFDDNAILSRRYCASTTHLSSAGSTDSDTTVHPLDPLSPDEITQASALIRPFMAEQDIEIKRFIAVSLKEPPKADFMQKGASLPRKAEAVVMDTAGFAHELTVDLSLGSVESHTVQPKGIQAMFTPAELDLAEEIVQQHPEVQAALKERYGITDMKRVACDPWGLHFSSEDERIPISWNLGRR